MEMDFASMKRRELQALCKRHGLSAGGSNAALVARLAATLSVGETEENMVGVVVGKGCLKRSGGGGGGSGAGKTVTFALEEEEEAEAEMETRGRGRRGRRPRVTWSPVAAKTRGRRKAGEMLTATEAGRGGGGKQRRGYHVGDDAAAEEQGAAGEPAADAPRRRSRRNVVNSSDGDGAEGDGVEVGEAVDKKRKQKHVTGDFAAEITVSAQDGVSGRSTRSSRLLTADTVVQSPVVEKKRGRKRKGDVKEQICLEVQEQHAEIQDDGRKLRSPPVVECRRSRRKAEDPIVEKAAKVNVSSRTKRSSSVAAAISSPVILENKRQKKEHVHLDVELPTVPVVQTNVAPSIRSLRNRVVQVSNSVIHNAAKTSMNAVVVREDENDGLTKKNVGRGRDKIAKSVGKVALSESSGEALPTELQLEVIEPLKGSRRRSVVSTLLEEGTKDMHGSVRGDDLEKQPTEKIPVRRSTQKSVVSAMLEKESNGVTTEMMPEAHIRRSRRKSFLPNMLTDEKMDHYEMVRNEELKDSKGKDAGKKLAIKEPARRSTRKSIVPGMLDRGTKGLTVEMNPEVHVRTSTRKSFIPNLLSDENMDHCEMVRNVVLKSSKDRDAGETLATKEPSRYSTRKSVVALLEKGTKGLLAEMNPDLHVRRSTRKSVVPNMPNNENKYHDELVRTVACVAAVKQLEAKKLVRSNEGGFKLGKRRRTSMEMSSSSSNNRKVSDKQKSRKQQKVQTPASKGPPGKESRTDVLQEIISFEEPNADADDLVVRESTLDGVEGCHDYCKDSSASTQEVNLDNATVEETRREQWVNSEVHGSDSGDAERHGENPEFCHLVATGSTHQCEKAQEYVNFRTESIIHLSGIGSEELDQSSITELVSRAGISSENKVLLDDAEADLGATVTQTLNADSNEEVLGDLNNPAAIAEEPRSATALPLLDSEAQTDKDVIITLPEQLLGALAKLPIVDQLPPCTSDALVIVNDSHACNVANWTAVKGTEDIQNVDIALSDDGLEASKSMTVAEKVLPCTAATVLEHGTLAEDDFERTCMKNGDASLSLFDSGSSGNETNNGSFKSLDFKLNHLPTVNNETGKQFEEGGFTDVASQQFHDTTVAVAEYDFSCQNDIHDVRTCINPLEHHQPCSDKISSDDFSCLSGRSELEPLDVVPIDCSTEDNEEQYSVSPVTEENRVNRENSNENTKKSLSDTVLSGLHTQDCCAPGQLVDLLAKETGKAFGSDVNSHQCSNGYKEADKCPEVHSDAATEKSNQSDDLCKNLSTVKGESALASNLHVEGAAEDRSMLQIQINAEWGSSDGRDSSFGLKSLFAEEGKQRRYLIDDENIAVEVDSRNKSSDGRHSSFGLKSLFAEAGNQQHYLIDDENIAVKVDSGNKLSDGRHSSFGLKSLFAEEGNQQRNLIDVENIVAKVDSGSKSSDGRHSSFGLKSLFAEESNQQHNLIDDENIAVKIGSGNKSSDERHSSFGLKSLFAEEGNQRRYLIDDENIAVKVDSGTKSIGCKTSTFYTRVDCHLEDAAAQLIGEGNNALDVEQGVADDKIILSPLNDFGACSSYGRNPSFGQRSLYAQEGRGSNVTNAVFVAAETDGRKDSDNIIVGLHMESDGIHIEMDVGLISDNPENKLALEPVLQGDAEEGKFEKPSLGLAIPDCKHQHALANEAVTHSVKNKRGSSTDEQSSSSPLSMSLQESMEETMGYGSLAFAGVHSDNGVDESNDCHTECRDDQTPVLEPVADHGTDVDFILVTKNGESNENEESPKASREEQVECGQLGLFKAANCTEMTNCQGVGYEGEDCSHVHSTDISTPSKDGKGNSDTLLSSSVIVANDNDVHLSSNISQLELTDCLDEPTLFFIVGVHQGPNEKCNKHMEDQVPSGVRTSDISVPATANGLESGLTSLPANETSNLQDNQLNSELESTQIVQSGISCAENSTNILELGFTVNVVDKGTPCDHSLPKDCPMDHYQQHERLDDIPAEKSLKASAMYLGNSVFRTEGIVEKPAINLATPDCKLQGALLEFSLKNDAETPNPKHLSFGLQTLFSEENMDGSRPHDNVSFPCAENKVDESNGLHGKCRVEKTVSPEPGLCEGTHDNLGIAKEIGCCVSSCQKVNEQEEFSEDSHKKGWVASVQLDSADDVNHTEREIISSEVVCEKEEKMEVMSSDIDTPLRESHASELSTHASPVSKTQICDPQSSPIFYEVYPSSNPSQMESPDVFHQDHEVLCRERNDQILPGIPSSPFSEAVSSKFPENETMLLEAAETSELLDEKLNPQPECDVLEEHDLSGVKDTEDSSDTEFVRYSIFRFPADGQIDSCQEMELPNDQSAIKAREESAFSEGESVVGTCETSEQRCQVEISTKLLRLNTEMPHQDCKEENNEHKADQVTPYIPTIDMSGAASTKGSEGGTTLSPEAKLSVFTDVQLNSKLENIGEHNLSCDKDSGIIFDNRSVDDSYHEQELLNDLSAPKSLGEPGSVCMDSCNWQAILEDMPGPKSPDVYQDDGVSGSAGDLLEPSPTERTEQETTLVSPSEMLVFKFEQLNNPNLVSIGGHNHSCDEDTGDMFSTEPVESNNQHEQELPNDVSAPVSLKESAICPEDTVHTESCPGKSLPEDISAPKSPEEPAIHQDDNVPGSAVLCQTSGRRRIDEMGTKLLSFKISSTVKTSHVAMNAPKTRQVDNLSESAIALLRNRENTPAIKTDRPVKPHPDRSVAKNSSRRPLQPISRRPEGH